ncbi:cytochrome P450 [Obba rivulosa]|uniref:Cytochrome P450 n=1 Tax=Obba rivulosa TaxID=1052685 RepID=A0A8E2DIJ5_9APHY|nr:cytochrome P450 [Obba rivulosa]
MLILPPYPISEVQLGILFLIFATLLAIRCHCHVKVTKGRLLPPGPPGRPIIGSILEVAQRDAPRVFTRYREQYGDLVLFQGLGKNVLVLNSLQAINDLLEKRAPIYSHRPVSVFGGELLGLNDTVVFLPYGEEWRAHRKLMHSALSPLQVREYHGIQADAAALLGKALLETPDEFWTLVRTYVGKIIIAITYGIPASSVQAELIEMGEELMEIGAKAAIPGNYLCDSVPLFKYAPSWVHFQREAQRGRQLVQKFITKPIEVVKHDMEAGIALPSFTQTLLALPQDEAPELERRIPWVSGTIFNAGAETTYATILSFILAMALNPDKQKLAQAEIDAVVGDGRLPNLEDRKDLPYVNAVRKETMRWLPAVPLGVPRRLIQDDFYGEYHIPKDTVIIPNAWAIAFAPNEKYDPQTFLPERFLDDSEPTTDPDTWAFGFGRRICPGRHLADSTIFIFIATLLAVFDISPPEDDEIVPEFTQHLVRIPQPFRCRISPRSDAKSELVKARAANSVV